MAKGRGAAAALDKSSSPAYRDHYEVFGGNGKPDGGGQTEPVRKTRLIRRDFVHFPLATE